MATFNITATISFPSVFAQFTDAKELKNYASELITEIKEAYDARIAELQADKTPAKEAKATKTTATKPRTKGVKVTPTTPQPTEVPQPKAEVKKTATKTTKTAKATEVAEEVKPTKATTKTTKATKTTKKGKSAEVAEISITEPGLIKKLGLTFEKYNERSWVLRGDTKPLRKDLKEQFGGGFNARLAGGEGWIFNNANAAKCAKALGFKIKTA